MARSAKYHPPTNVVETSLLKVLAATGRQPLPDNQLDLLRQPKTGSGKGDVPVFYAGDIKLLQQRCVSIVGTREVSENGYRRASKLARELSSHNINVVSGLARGVDTAALSSAMESGGRTVAVIGTPLGKAYPAENYRLQEEIWKNQLLLTPFSEEELVYKSNFPKRNRVMAAISDATVIVEATDTSGTLHQAAECQRLGRWLFIMKSVAEDPSLSWPTSFLGKPRTEILTSTEDLLRRLS